MAFEITRGEVEVNGRYTRQPVFVDAGKPGEIEIQVCECDYGELVYCCVEGLVADYPVGRIPALRAALDEAERIAREWESEGQS